MPDICMCYGDGCMLKDRCHRYKAIPYREWQSYFAAPPIKPGEKCKYYWPENREDTEE